MPIIAPARQLKRGGWPVASSTDIHRSPFGSTWLRLPVAREMGRCTKRPCQRPTTIAVRPAIAACAAAWRLVMAVLLCAASRAAGALMGW
jgi:hypothetical protein